METTAINKSKTEATIKPKLGFLGLGWIGRNRLQALANSGKISIEYLCDLVPGNVDEALECSPDAQVHTEPEDLFSSGVDAVVIATPSALHAPQAIEALSRGLGVFCQKPLGRTAAETAAVVEAARQADKYLGVDLSYRSTAAMQEVYKLVRSGELGDIYAVELVFHNAYGPDKPWFYDSKLSGGGCVIDLGVHLVDLALWTLDFPEADHVSSKLYSKGQLVTDTSETVEDYATAAIQLENNTGIQLSCSWNLHAGQEAVIKACFYGTKGAACFRNVNGSFYDFVAERYDGTETTTLCTPPDDWMGRAAVEWAEQMVKNGNTFDPKAMEFVKVSEILDRIYGRK